MVNALFADEISANIIAEDDKNRIFSFIDSRVTTPLKPEWADWLINQGIVSADPLVSFGGLERKDRTYRLFHSPDSETVDEMVLGGLREGNLK